ncbi:ribbon-helix-helix domain-containing protein [Marinibaculum pumilum]|uniref:Ribbon-helix-helix domain-containing protein n=1 Tax=Marinibaculum pumilum TaxID=1766165 RepID=A0ABV7L6Y7_9PROT
MAKKPNLKEALGSIASSSRRPVIADEPQSAHDVPPAAPDATAEPVPARQARRPQAASGSRAPSRVGRRMIAGHFEPEVSQQLRILCAQHDLSVQDMLREALNDLFRKYGQPPIA